MIDEFLQESSILLLSLFVASRRRATHVYGFGDDAASAQGDEAGEQQTESADEECDGHQQEKQLRRVMGVRVASIVVGKNSDDNDAQDLSGAERG